MGGSAISNYEEGSEYTGGIKSEGSSMSPLKIGKARTFIEPESATLPNSTSGLPRKASTSGQSGGGNGGHTNRQMRPMNTETLDRNGAIIAQSATPNLPNNTF